MDLVTDQRLIAVATREKGLQLIGGYEHDALLEQFARRRGHLARVVERLGSDSKRPDDWQPARDAAACGSLRNAHSDTPSAARS